MPDLSSRLDLAHAPPNRRRRWLRTVSVAALGLLALLMARPGLASGLGPAGVFSHVDGAVRVEVGGRLELARSLQPIAAGARVVLGEGASAVLLCPGDRVVRLQGPKSWSARPAESDPDGVCAGGQSVASGTYARFLPRAGAVRAFHGSLIEESASRSDDQDGRVPVLMRPRSPTFRSLAIGEGSPRIEWTAVHGAQRYELRLVRGSEAFEAETHAIDPHRADCRRDRYAAPLRVCSADWPFAPLRPGDAVRLAVDAHTADLDWAVRKGDESRLHRLAAADQDRFDRTIARLDGLALSEADGASLRADAYAAAGLYNEAGGALASALESRAESTLSLALADLWLGLGLLRPALAAYQRTQQLLPPRGEEATRGAVHLGLARVYQQREQTGAARREFEQAARFFDRVDATGRAAAIRAEAARLPTS